MELRGFSPQVPRVMAMPRQIPRLWPRHVAVVLLWQTPSYQPWQHTGIRGNCRGNFHGHPRSLPRQRGNHHGSPRQSPRQFQRTFNRTNFHGHPRPSAYIATAILRYAATSTGARGTPRLLQQHVPWFCPWQSQSDQSSIRYIPLPCCVATVGMCMRGWQLCGVRLCGGLG